MSAKHTLEAWLRPPVEFFRQRFTLLVPLSVLQLLGLWHSIQVSVTVLQLVLEH